jgi:thiamine-monophosphate kinase
MIDVSDGLLADLGHIARASGVLIDLDSGALRPADRLQHAARAVAAAALHNPGDRTSQVSRPAEPDALTWVLTGGEDHALVAAFPAGTRLPPRWTVIGTVRRPAGDPGGGVVLDGQPRAGLPGWDHFS